MGTPLFFYSLKALREQINRLRDAVSAYPVQLLFATMANDRPEILRVISGEGVGACVNSLLHLHKASDHGFAFEKIQFTSCGVPVADMAFLQALSIPANLDSPSQIEAWCSLTGGRKVGARVNAASLPGSTAQADRIGMSLSDLERARQIAASLGSKVNGIHVYAGTNFQAASAILPILRGAFEVVRRYPDIEYINIGGGIGIDYMHNGPAFNYKEFGNEICSLARGISEKRGFPLQVLFEPGRSLVGCSATFITRVTDIKDLGDRRFVVVDGSVSVFPRPFHQPGSLHRLRILDPGEQNGHKLVTSVVCGRTTFSRDILGTYELPENLPLGAFLAFDDAGAYCESMMSRFLGQKEPVSHITED
jgi:diaminopimelate decarboxylase